LSLAFAQRLVAGKRHRAHCPRCAKTTGHEFELDVPAIVPSYAYRCDDCTCLTETGVVLIEAKRARTARPL
jgi:hypothetical protein